MLKRLLLLGLLCVTVGANAVSKPAANLANYLDGFNTMKANFKQVIYDEKQQPIQNSSGSMVLNRPGFFRWYTHQPNRQILVVKEGKVWIYDIDLEQLTINKLELQQDSAPAVLLSDTTDDLDTIYTIAEKPGKKADSTWFTLTPKSEQDNFVWVKFLFDGSKIAKMEFKDKMNQISKIKFSNIVLNKPITTKVFEIKPAKGVDVIDNTKADAERG